jgi:CBS domain containing-hemolysin-like protein
MALALALVGVLVLAAASFFFALAETALFALGKWQARQLAERVPGRGTVVAHLLEEPHDLLATIVLGNTFANAGLVALGLGLSLDGNVRHIALMIAALLVFIVLGGEVVPKTLAVRMPEAWALRVAGPMFLFVRLTRPVRHIAQRLNSAVLRVFVPGSVKPASPLTEAEYKELIEMASQQGALAHSEKEIILQIIRLDRRTAREVMRPRAKMACISDDLSVGEMVEAARRHRHRRLPIFDETPDTIVSVLNVRVLLLNPGVDLAEAIEFPSFVPEAMNLLHLLQSLQRQQRGLAVVLDEFGGTAGVVTMEDILESIIGGVHDRGTSDGFVMEKLAEGRWRVNGLMRIEDFRREFPDLQPQAEVDTMGGLLVAQLHVVPAQGECAVVHGLKLTARVADERRVRELLVEKVTR